MVYLVIQGQAGSVLKYGETKEALITLNERDAQAELVISEGTRFDKEGRQRVGIGCINIFNKVDACNGTMDLYCAPVTDVRKIIFPPATNG